MTIDEPIVDPGWPAGPKQGWLGKDLSKANLTVEFTKAQRQALTSLVRRASAANLPFASITRTMFSDPAIDGLFRRVKAELKRGVGLCFLRGMDVADFSVDELRILFFGMGTHFGQALSQSKFGDMLGEVTAQPGRKASSRGYVVSAGLPYHTDHAEMFGLFCVVDAKQGGENAFISSLALYDVLKREHPEYISILERGFRMWLFDEQRLGVPSVTPHRVPVYSSKNGLQSCYMSIESAPPAAEAIGEPLSPLEKEAVTYFIEARNRPELQFTAALEPGEAVFINNFEIMHARMPFVPHEERPRHLLRLWLQDEMVRPMVPEIPLFRHLNMAGRQGIDAIPQPERDLQIEAAGRDPISRHMLEALKQYN